MRGGAPPAGRLCGAPMGASGGFLGVAGRAADGYGAPWVKSGAGRALRVSVASV